MAVYTDVGVEELQTFLADYDLGDVLSYKGIAEGVENSNFLLHTTGGYFILTLYEKRVAEHDLPFFLALMEHLHGHGPRVAQVLRQDELVLELVFVAVEGRFKIQRQSDGIRDRIQQLVLHLAGNTLERKVTGSC